MENKKKIFTFVIIAVLLAGNIVLGYLYYRACSEIKAEQKLEMQTEFHQKVLSFMSLFVNKVLQANTQVDFNTRLALENSVRDLNDSDVMTAWQDFTASKTEADAQSNVKNLLSILVAKLQN